MSTWPQFRTLEEKLKYYRSKCRILEQEKANSRNKQKSDTSMAKSSLIMMCRFLGQEKEDELWEIVNETHIMLDQFHKFIAKIIDDSGEYKPMG